MSDEFGSVERRKRSARRALEASLIPAMLFKGKTAPILNLRAYHNEPPRVPKERAADRHDSDVRRASRARKKRRGYR